MPSNSLTKPQATSPYVLAHSPEVDAIRRREERKGKISAMVVTLVIHAVAILVLTLILIPVLQPEPPLIQAKAMAPSETPMPVQEIQTTVKSRPASTSSSSRVITSHSRASEVFLPSVNSQSDAIAMGTGTSVGLGFGMGSFGSGTGGAGSLFGTPGGGAGLIGTFYDFKRRRDGASSGIKAYDRATYTEILKGFVGGSVWRPASRHAYFTSPTRLASSAFFFPAIADTEAGKAFKSPETGPGMWLAHYTGRVTPSESGEFRLVGWGDNVMVVAIDGRIVLDASDLPYLNRSRDGSIGQVDFPAKGNTPVFAGRWFRVLRGSSVRLDVLLGDEGGIYCAGIHLQRKEQELKFGRGGIPSLPLFRLADFKSEDQKLYHPHLGAEAFQGPVFHARGN